MIMKRSKLLRLLIALAMGLAVCSSAWGQVTSRVTGVIRDKTGAVVSDAKVTLTNEATNVSLSTTTTSAGTYTFDGIQPRPYQLTVEMPGLSSAGPTQKSNTFCFTNLQVRHTLRTVHISRAVLTHSARKGLFRYGI